MTCQNLPVPGENNSQWGTGGRGGTSNLLRIVNLRLGRHGKWHGDKSKISALLIEKGKPQGSRVRDNKGGGNKILTGGFPPYIIRNRFLVGPRVLLSSQSFLPPSPHSFQALLLGHQAFLKAPLSSFFTVALWHPLYTTLPSVPSLLIS